MTVTGRPWPRPTIRFTIAGYALALLPVGIAVLLKSSPSLQAVLDVTTLLLGTVVITAWFGGWAPGLVAAVLATLAIDYYFVPPLYTLTVSVQKLPQLTIFMLSAALVGWGSVRRRRAERLLVQARDDLEATVLERTADLRHTNEKLEGEIAERKRADQALNDLAGRLINAQEEERSRIGRELHDHVSQRLALLSIAIDQLRAGPSMTPDLRGGLDGVRRQTSEITDDIHGLSHRLHSSMLDHLGLVPALQRLVSECSDRHGIPIAFTHALSNGVPSDVALCLFRIVEESLTNVAKHSRARSARVDVTGTRQGIRLVVEDEGRGFNPEMLATKAGLGVVSMRERLRLIHGTIDIRSAPSRGTRIDVWVPSAPRANG